MSHDTNSVLVGKHLGIQDPACKFLSYTRNTTLYGLDGVTNDQAQCELSSACPDLDLGVRLDRQPSVLLPADRNHLDRKRSVRSIWQYSGRHVTLLPSSPPLPSPFTHPSPPFPSNFLEERPFT